MAHSGMAAAPRGGVGLEYPPPPAVISVVSRELLLEGPWGLPPSVLHNLSLENCKFISQKGLRAEMSSKRTNHFLQSLTELRLGGKAGVTIGGGLHSHLSNPLVFPQTTAGLGPTELEPKVGPGGPMGGHKLEFQTCVQGLTIQRDWKWGAGPCPESLMPTQTLLQ